MNATLRGRFLGVLAFSLFVLAFVLGSVAPALAALALLAMLDAAQRSVRISGVQATRQVPSNGHVGQPFEANIEVVIGSGAPSRLRASIPDGTKLRSQKAHEGPPNTLIQSVVAEAPGTHEFPPLNVDVQDRWGTSLHSLQLDAPAAISISPETKFLEDGRRAGRRHTVQESVPDPQMSEELPEVELIRPYHPSDKSRDIDWRVSTRLGTLHSRLRERAAPRNYAIFMDATRSMRRPGLVPKLRTASRVAIGIAGAAQGAGVSASLVAFHEGGILTAGQASHRASTREVLDRLGKLPSVEGTQDIRLVADLDRTPTIDERQFLQRLSPLTGAAPAAPTLDAALAALNRAVGGRCYVVAIMDGEVNPKRVEVAVRRLTLMGHKVCVIIPATGPHHVSRDQARKHDHDLRLAMSRRKQLVHRLTTQGIACHVVAPGDEEDVVREVARNAV